MLLQTMHWPSSFISWLRIVVKLVSGLICSAETIAESGRLPITDVFDFPVEVLALSLVSVIRDMTVPRLSQPVPEPLELHSWITPPLRSRPDSDSVESAGIVEIFTLGMDRGMKNIILAGVVVALAAAAGCSTNEPSTGLFAHLIEKDLGKECVTLGEVSIPPLPIEVNAEYASHEGGIDAFVEAGLVRRVELEKTGKDWRGRDVPQKVYVYELTEAGKKDYLVKNMRAFLGGELERGNFCAYDYALEEVVNFTAPTANALMEGATASIVSYRVSPKAIRPWTQTAAAKKAFPKMEKALSKGQKQEAIFLLTNNGWVSESEWSAKN